MAATATVVYFLYILSGFMDPTSGGDLFKVATFQTQAACDADQAALEAQLKAEQSNDKIDICISSADLNAFLEKAAGPYINK